MACHSNSDSDMQLEATEQHMDRFAAVDTTDTRRAEIQERLKLHFDDRLANGELTKAEHEHEITKLKLGFQTKSGAAQPAVDQNMEHEPDAPPQYMECDAPPETCPLAPSTTDPMGEAREKKRSRQHLLSRKLGREKIMCPGWCGKLLQLSTIQYAHKCKAPRSPPSEREVAERLEKMRARATRGFSKRVQS